MYKVLLVVAMLATAACSFPTSDVDDSGATRRLEGDSAALPNPATSLGDGKIDPTDLSTASLGNPAELLDNSTPLAEKPRGARRADGDKCLSFICL
jgi:hypothetical protein